MTLDEFDKSHKWEIEVIAPIVDAHLKSILHFCEEIGLKDQNRLHHNFQSCGAISRIGRLNGNGLLSILELYQEQKNKPHPAQFSFCVDMILRKMGEYVMLHKIPQESLVRYGDNVMEACRIAKESGHHGLVSIMQAMPEKMVEQIYSGAKRGL